MKTLRTERLVVRPFTVDDSAFILTLLNNPSWIQYIGDRGIRTLDEARAYLLKGPIEMYARFGFGLCMVELINDATPIGLCGLIKRDALDDVDIGFAFMPEFSGKGYGYESAAAVLEYAKDTLGLKRIVAITTEDNKASLKLLEKLGLTYESKVRMPGDDEEILLLSINLDDASR
ncbi:MAG: GNAT family N-acetyltransferase [Acidobacteriota bacterium]